MTKIDQVEDWPITVPDVPTFKTAKEQFFYYLNRFCHFYAFLTRQAGLTDGMEDDRIDSVLKCAPEDFVIAKVADIHKLYGFGLKDRKMVTVSQVIAYLSDGLGTVSDLTEHMTKMTEYLISNEKYQRRFFSYWDTLANILGLHAYYSHEFTCI